MSVYWIDPLQDPRWPALVERHPRSSIFHTREWLEALKTTYGFQPWVITTSAPEEELRNAVVLCRVDSWLTGRRLVSLPFADHCEPLLPEPGSLDPLLDELTESVGRNRLKYVELRPLFSLNDAAGSSKAFQPSRSFVFHGIDLRQDVDELRRHLHKDCVLRKIRKAEQSGLRYDEGRDGSHLARFYHLQILTRRRHGLPPQPFAWFRNLLHSLGEKASIQIASDGGRPVAAILTFRHKQTLTYKYGCSDERFNRLGGMQSLMWRAIQGAKEQGALEFDMGRSDTDQAGLIAFKDRFGALRSTLTYYRCPQRLDSKHAGKRWATIARRLPALMPAWVLTGAGKLLYRHIA